MNNTIYVLDDKAQGLAEDYLRMEAELLLVLIELRERKAFAALNYTGVFDYCERRLKLSRAQSYYFKSVAETSEAVPEFKAAVLQGELTLSQARRIAPVITKDNHAQWIKKAKTLRQTELEKEVTIANPRAHVREKIRPVAKELSELRVALDPKAEENLKVLQDVLSQKLGKPATLSEVIGWMAGECRERFDPVKRAERARVISSRKISTPRAGRRAVPASVKHPVVLRDQMQCTHVGPDQRRCTQKRWLQLHHIKEVAKGGLNTVDNLRLLCHAHHALLHSC